MKFLLVALPLLMVAFSGCTTTPQFVEPPMEDGKYVITMTAAWTFSPSLAEVPAGSTIIFRNASPSTWHDAVSANNAFKSPRVEVGEEWELTLNEPGDYEYHCTPHKGSGMVGTIRVV